MAISFSSSDAIPISTTYYNPFNNITPTSGTWTYMLITQPTTDPIYITIPVNFIDTLNVVLIANGGSGGSDWYIPTPLLPVIPNIPLAAGGGGGGGAVLVSSYNTSDGMSFTVTLGAIGSSNNSTSIQYTNSIQYIYSGNAGSNGTLSDNVPIGGDGGDGGDGGTSSETYGGPGGNGGLAPFPETSGSPGQSYNGASSAGIGNQPPAYTPITMADGTSAYVGYAGKQNEGGNCAQLLLYYQT